MGGRHALIHGVSFLGPVLRALESTVSHALWAVIAVSLCLAFPKYDQRALENMLGEKRFSFFSRIFSRSFLPFSLAFSAVVLCYTHSSFSSFPSASPPFSLAIRPRVQLLALDGPHSSAPMVVPKLFAFASGKKLSYPRCILHCVPTIGSLVCINFVVAYLLLGRRYQPGRAKTLYLEKGDSESMSERKGLWRGAGRETKYCRDRRR